MKLFFHYSLLVYVRIITLTLKFSDHPLVEYPLYKKFVVPFFSFQYTIIYVFFLSLSNCTDCPLPTLAVYTASKAGLKNLTHGMRPELSKYGIKVKQNSIYLLYHELKIKQCYFDIQVSLLLLI